MNCNGGASSELSTHFAFQEVMNQQTKNLTIAVLIGSLRKESFTRKVANAMIALAPKTLELKIIEIGNLPLYNEDLDQDPPEAWTNFRNQLKSADGVLFFTPEYNRSVPGVLKNAIDVGSRPQNQNAWDGKPGAVVSVSPYSMGAFGANHHLRQSLVFLNVPTMQQPEAYLANVGKFLNEKGEVTQDSTKALMQKFMNAFEVWAQKNART